MTYGQLVGQVEYVGEFLRRLGIRRTDRVAIALPNGPEMAAAFLGVASYSTCAPLNPSYRQDDFNFYLADLGVKAIVLPAAKDVPARQVATRLGLTTIDLEPSLTDVAGNFTLRTPRGEDHRANGLPDCDVQRSRDWGTANDIALVLHTSGTTSRPKQVPLSHGNLCASAGNITAVLALSPEDRCLNVMPLFHIHGLVGVLLSSIAAGGSVVCSAGYDDRTFSGMLSDFEATWYSAVPTIHQSILAQAKDQPASSAGRRLRFIRSSSSALPPTVMTELEKVFGVPVIEAYGMTEASHQMASNPLPPAKRKPGSVGMPAGPQMAIMDDRGNLLAPEETGEIVIRGANVTAGYFNNPTANAASFTYGWFRTGDLGRMDCDGYIYILGRTKEMINRGGEKISPREIDEALLEHPAVLQAVAFAVPHPTLGEDVAAAVVLRAGMILSEKDLRDFAFTRLADFKVPSKIIFVDAVPKGPTGKVQRIGLYEQLAPLIHEEYAPPDGPVENKLAALWRELLSLPRVGRNDNFFVCGGDSLLAVRLVSRVRSDLHVDLSLPSLFHQPTLHALAALIGADLQAATLADEREIAAELSELEGISDEEAERLLAEEGQDPPLINAASANPTVGNRRHRPFEESM
jgi:oxalate---CoA ligase